MFYLVGASGVGKSSLVDYARRQLGDSHPIMFAHRYVTRHAASGAHNEIALSEAEFALRKRHGLFVMSWESRSIRYGIGNEINYWLAMGLSVVVKGSRTHLGEALKAYPEMTTIWVASTPEPSTARRPLRPRDSGREIGTQSDHGHAIVAAGAARRMVYISNDRSLTPAGEKLVAVLLGEP